MKAQRHSKRSANADDHCRLADDVSHDAALEKPSARSAAISPNRWFTETVSSTVMSSNAKNERHRDEHRRDLAEIGKLRLLQARDDLGVRERMQVRPPLMDGRLQH